MKTIKTEIEADAIGKCDGTDAGHKRCMMSRRQFMFYSSAGAVAASTISLSLLPGSSHAATQQARVVGYPRQLVAKMSELKNNEPITFNYPDDHASATCMLAKMGVRSGGGIGKKEDVVAFSLLCTHQGGPLHGSYKATDEHRTLGPCPLHLSLFDLRRHGIIVSGQAYESLPQVLLELDGDEIYAVGMMGLIFGRNKNLMDT